MIQIRKPNPRCTEWRPGWVFEQFGSAGRAAIGELVVSCLMNNPMTYSESLESVDAADLEGFLSHWDFTPPAGTLLRMLKGSSVVILARNPDSSQICGYVAALTDHVACAYISAIEVRPEYRKRGIGMALLNRMTERLSVYGTYLSCAPAMIPFYESAGFKQVAGMTKRRVPVANEA